MLRSLNSPDALASLTQDEEVEFVRQLKAHDSEAFRILVERTQSRVFSIIYRILRGGNDAEDISQQVFVRIFKSIENFDHRGSLVAWVSKIAVNECYSYFRARRAKPLTLVGDLTQSEEFKFEERSSTMASQGVAADVQMARRQMAETLLCSIGEEDRALIVLKEIEGLSIDEISAAIGIKPGAVKTRLFRIRQKMLRTADKRHMRQSGGFLLTGKPIQAYA